MDARTFPMYMTSSIPVESWRVEGNATSNSQSRSSSERTEREAPRRVVRSISRREERPRWFSDILSRWLAVPVVGRGGEVGTPVVPDCTLLRSGGARGSSGEPSNQSWISHHRPENVIFGPTPSAPPALARSLSLSLSLSPFNYTSQTKSEPTERSERRSRTLSYFSVSSSDPYPDGVPTTTTQHFTLLPTDSRFLLVSTWNFFCFC